MAVRLVVLRNFADLSSGRVELMQKDIKMPRPAVLKGDLWTQQFDSHNLKYPGGPNRSHVSAIKSRNQNLF